MRTPDGRGRKRSTRLRSTLASLVVLTTAVGVTASAPPVLAADPVGLDGPAAILALDHTGRTVTLAPFPSCSTESTTIRCNARRIDRFTGDAVSLPPLIVVSANQTTLITADRRWLDVDTGTSTALPSEMSTTAAAPVTISADGRVYAGSNADRTAGWVVDGPSGVVQPLPMLGSPISLSETGRFVLIRSVNHCQDPDRSECDVYLWDRAFGVQLLIADARLMEYASTVAADGSVIVASGSFDHRVFRLRQIGANAAVLTLSMPFGEAFQFAASISDDGSTAIFGRFVGPGGAGYSVVDLGSGHVLSTFGSISGGFSTTSSWWLSGDGSTLATQYMPGNNVLLGQLPKLSFEALRPPTARVHAAESFPVAVAGTAQVPADASAVMVNVTVTDPAADGYVTVWPCGQPVPLASNGNFSAGQTIAAAALVRVGQAGRVCVTSNVAINVIVDVQGWFGPLAPYHGITPIRLLDSRAGLGTATGSLLAPGVLRLPVGGNGAATPDATTAVLDVAAVDPSADGHVTVWPCDQPKPTTSNLNFRAGTTVANLVVATLDPSGAVCLASNVATEVVVDEQGWFGSDGDYRSIHPTRLTDTRNGDTDLVGNLVAGTRLVVPIDATVGDATAAMLNVTVTNPSTAGWVVAWPCAEERPLASNVNFVAGQTLANAVLASVDPAGDVCIESNTTVDVVVDLAGTFGPMSQYHPLTPKRVVDTRT